MSSHPISCVSTITFSHPYHALPSSLFKFSNKNPAFISFLTNTSHIPYCARHPRSCQQNNFWWEVHKYMSHMLLVVWIITIICYCLCHRPACFSHRSVLCPNNVTEQEHVCMCIHTCKEGNFYNNWMTYLLLNDINCFVFPIGIDWPRVPCFCKLKCTRLYNFCFSSDSGCVTNSCPTSHTMTLVFEHWSLCWFLPVTWNATVSWR